MAPNEVEPVYTMAVPVTPADAVDTARLDEVRDRVLAKLTPKLDLEELKKLPEDRRAASLRPVIASLLDHDSAPLTTAERRGVIQGVLDEILGLGPLEKLLRDAANSDILVNGPNEVFVERRGRLEEAAVHFRDNDHLLQIIERIVSRVGRRIDDTNPLVDARLPDGSRVNAIVPPLASKDQR